MILLQRFVHKSRFRDLINSVFTSKTKMQSITSTMDNDSWKGVSLAEIRGSQSPWGSPEFPLVSPGFNHAVLYHIPSSGSLTSEAPPRPQISQDKWDHDHVRMPCSSKSLYPVKDSNGDTQLKKRWEIIEEALSKPLRNSKELADAILSYNTKFKKIWRFLGLHQLFEEYLEEEETQYFFDVTLPEIAKLALSLPKLIQAPIPLLKIHKNRSVSLSQQQAACLLANAFFCTFPRRNTFKNTSEYASYPHINFNSLYESYESQSTLEKLKSLCHYFRRVCTKVPVGVLTFSRRSVPRGNCPKWSECHTPIANLPLHVDSSLYIEDAHGLIQMDFANKFLGGGVLKHGCVQEEIRFVICPELMISMLITEVMLPDEALMMIGSERYSSYTGYGGTFQWAGDFADQTPYDSSGRRRCAVLAVDAVRYANKAHQYVGEHINRELNKAWIGFSFYTDESSSSLNYPGIATGNWGCGAFGGSPELKSLLQMMACVKAGRPISYCTFQDTELRDELAAVYEMLLKYNVTVGQLYNIIIRFSTLNNVKKTNLKPKLFPYLHQALRDREREQSRAVEEPMETSFQNTTDTNEDDTSLSKREELLNASPDLFSEEFDSISETDIQNIVKDSDITKNDTLKKDLQQENKQRTTSKNSSKLFEELDKQDEENGMLSVNKLARSSVPQTKVHVVNEINQKSDHQSSSDNKRVCRVSLFDEMQKFDEENGKLNLNSSSKNTSFLHNKSDTNETAKESEPQYVSLDSESVASRKSKTNGEVTKSSIDGAAISNEMSPELKKKLSKKITDYFSKKS